VITFTKTPEADNPNDVTTVTVKVDSTDVTVDELLEHFADFLACCGFAKYTFTIEEQDQ
jgi:hypothetical protein